MWSYKFWEFFQLLEPYRIIDILKQYEIYLVFNILKSNNSSKKWLDIPTLLYVKNISFQRIN